MPKSNQSNRPKKTPKSKRRKPRRSNGSSQGPVFESAPTAVSGSISQYTRILPTGRDDAVRIRARIPFGTASETSGIAAGITVGSNNVSYVALSPDFFVGRNTGSASLATSSWLNPTMSRLASIFAKYRVHDLKIDYFAQQITTQPGNFVLAYSSDPCSQRIWKFNTDALTYSDALALPDSMPYAPWRSFRLDLSKAIDKKTEHYCNMQSMVSVAVDEDYTAMMSLLRQCCFGALLVMKSANATAGLVHGIFYMELDIEFFEWMSNLDANPNLAPGRGKVMLGHAQLDGSPSIKLEGDKCKDDSCTSSTLTTKVKDEIKKEGPCECKSKNRIPLVGFAREGVRFEACLSCGKTFEIKSSIESKECA